MNDYKSKEVKFFRNKKLLFIGEPVLPTLIKLIKKITPCSKTRDCVWGRLIEVTTIACFIISLFLIVYKISA